MSSTRRRQGFTIVELLIVIVVIGILAAITIVAYNGIQDRATWAKLQGDLSGINKSIQLYYAENGSYPATAVAPGWSWRYSCATGVSGDSFIPDISTTLANLPQAPCKEASTGNDTWLYGSDGIEYKLIHIRPTISDTMRSNIPSSLRDNRWSTNGSWGYWSPTAAGR